VFVITGTSGSGKDSIIRILLDRGLRFHKVRTALTRQPRVGEQHAREHFFISKDEFLEWRKDGRFLEWADVYGYLYGTPRSEVEPFLQQGKDVLLRVDIQGARTVAQLIPEAVVIFIAPPSREEGFRRLSDRDSDGDGHIALRLAAFEQEMAFGQAGVHIVINHTGRQEEAADEVAALMKTARAGQAPKFPE
jgi:guanylate kinase